MKSKLKALGQIPRLLVEIPEQIGSSGLSWVVKGFDKAYGKMSRKKSPENNDVLKDIEDYAEEQEPKETKPKKKGIFNFWK